MTPFTVENSPLPRRAARVGLREDVRVPFASGMTPARRLFALLLVSLAAAAGSLVAATPAVAHARLVSVTPKDGSTLTSRPALAQLTFSEEVSSQFVTVEVSGPGGSSGASGRPVTKGTVVTQPLAADLEPGEYTVSYRVVSVDGHPITGETSFRYDPPAPEPAPTKSEPATSTPAVGDGSMTTAGAPSEGAGDTTAVVTPVGAKVDEGSVPWWVWIVAAGVLLGGLTALLRGRRRGSH